MAITLARRLLGAGALAACAFVPATAHADTDAAVVKQINAARGRQGLAPLRMSTALDRAAAAHCQEMLADQSFSHASPAGALGPRLKRYTSASSFGETIAWMPSSAAARVVRAWLNSPPHRAVLLSGSFHRIGVAAKAGNLGGQRGTTFTADLAS